MARKKDLAGYMVTTVILKKHSFIEDPSKTEKVRIMRSKKGGWDLFFHKYDQEISEILDRPSYEIAASDRDLNVKGSLKELLSDFDDGLFS